MECTSHGGVLVKQKENRAVLAIIASEKPAQGLAQEACSGPVQLAAIETSAAVEGVAPAAFEGALPEEGAAPGTTGNIG